MKNSIYRFEELPFDEYCASFESLSYPLPFTTPEWLVFLSEAKNVDFRVLEIYSQGGDKLGLFIFGIFKVGPFRLAASPYFGWDSETMGPLLDTLEPQGPLLKELSYFLKQQYRVSLFQASMVEGSSCFDSKGYVKKETFTSPVVDISLSEDLLFSSFRKDVRTNVRFFAKKGGSFKMLVPNKDTFSSFYDMTLDVYARRGMQPLYSKDFFQKMFDAFYKAYEKRRCLALGAYDEHGKCIAISVVLIFGEEATLQCLSDYEEGLRLHPIEALLWKNVQELKQMGVKRFDLMGESGYQNKFCPVHREVARFYYGSRSLVFLQSKARSLLERRNQKKEEKAKASREKKASSEQ